MAHPSSSSLGFVIKASIDFLAFSDEGLVNERTERRVFPARPGRAQLLSGSGFRHPAGPATPMPHSGGPDVPGGGTHLQERCRSANPVPTRSHTLSDLLFGRCRPARPVNVAEVAATLSQRRIAPAGTRSRVAYRQSAISSLRAKATASRLRRRRLASRSTPRRFRYHCESSLLG